MHPRAILFLLVVAAIGMGVPIKSQDTTSTVAQATPTAAMPGTAQFDRHRRAEQLLTRVADLRDRTISQCRRAASRFQILAAKAHDCEVIADETYRAFTARMADAKRSDYELSWLAQKVNDFEMAVSQHLQDMERIR